MHGYPTRLGALMKPSTIEWILNLTKRLESGADRLIIDGDTHVTDVQSFIRSRGAENPLIDCRYYHGRPITAEELLAEMAMSEIDMALIWQNPAATPYEGDQESNSRSLLAANQYIQRCAKQYPERFIPAGWVDPKSCGVQNSLSIVATLVREFGFVIIKMNPAQNGYPINSPDALTLVDRIVSLGAVPAFHVGADSPYTPADGLRQVAERHPDYPIIAIHMGGGGASYEAAEGLYRDVESLGLEHPNVRHILSAMRDTYIEDAFISYQLAGEPFCYNLFCGSDAPYGRQSWNFGGFRAMLQTLMNAEEHPSSRLRNQRELFTPQVAQNYLGGNLARFLVSSYNRLLDVNKGDPTACR